MRAGKRKREIGLLQEALDTLDGFAGQWLADNEVQQIEGQLALTKTTLDEVQKTAAKDKKESNDKIKDLEAGLSEELVAAKEYKKQLDDLLEEEMGSEAFAEYQKKLWDEGPGKDPYHEGLKI